MTVEPFFLSVGGRSRFCLYHPSASSSMASRGAIVYIHPFAEEMNFSRRMAALQSRALAAQGYAVLQIDLLGCGDSAGDFSEAGWSDWVADIVAAARWVQSRHSGGGAIPLTFWGLRAGCLLAAEAASAMDEPVDFLFWQPVLSGDLYWRQFKRLAVAADALKKHDAAGENHAGRVTKPVAAIDAAIEIAGYCISPALVAGLSAARLTLPECTRRVRCIEVSTGQAPDAAALSPALAAAVTAWCEQGKNVNSRVVPGPAFWQIAEAEDCPTLRAATAQLLAEDGNDSA
ncbi:MAG: hydrolase 2, exosortase A system-associated [Rugosibacter sp.]|nr:hydrolase 2, exosortase A system-associated [Rugosibacter sp.]